MSSARYKSLDEAMPYINRCMAVLEEKADHPCVRIQREIFTGIDKIKYQYNKNPSKIFIPSVDFFTLIEAWEQGIAGRIGMFRKEGTTLYIRDVPVEPWIGDFMVVEGPVEDPRDAMFTNAWDYITGKATTPTSCEIKLNFKDSQDDTEFKV